MSCPFGWVTKLKRNGPNYDFWQTKNTYKKLTLGFEFSLGGMHHLPNILAVDLTENQTTYVCNICRLWMPKIFCFKFVPLVTTDKVFRILLNIRLQIWTCLWPVTFHTFCALHLTDIYWLYRLWLSYWQTAYKIKFIWRTQRLIIALHCRLKVTKDYWRPFFICLQLSSRLKRLAIPRPVCLFYMSLTFLLKLRNVP